MKINCWKHGHLIWSFAFGLPGLLIFILIIPVVGTVFLIINKKKSNQPQFMQYYILLYQGYKNSVIYWEFSNIF